MPSTRRALREAHAEVCQGGDAALRSTYSDNALGRSQHSSRGGCVKDGPHGCSDKSPTYAKGGSSAGVSYNARVIDGKEDVHKSPRITGDRGKGSVLRSETSNLRVPKRGLGESSMVLGITKRWARSAR